MWPNKMSNNMFAKGGNYVFVTTRNPFLVQKVSATPNISEHNQMFKKIRFLKS